MLIDPNHIKEFEDLVRGQIRRSDFALTSHSPESAAFHISITCLVSYLLQIHEDHLKSAPITIIYQSEQFLSKLGYRPIKLFLFDEFLSNCNDKVRLISIIVYHHFFTNFSRKDRIAAKRLSSFTNYAPFQKPYAFFITHSKFYYPFQLHLLHQSIPLMFFYRLRLFINKIQGFFCYSDPKFTNIKIIESTESESTATSSLPTDNKIVLVPGEDWRTSLHLTALQGVKSKVPISILLHWLLHVHMLNTLSLKQRVILLTTDMLQAVQLDQIDPILSALTNVLLNVSPKPHIKPSETQEEEEENDNTPALLIPELQGDEDEDNYESTDVTTFNRTFSDLYDIVLFCRTFTLEFSTDDWKMIVPMCEALGIAFDPNSPPKTPSTVPFSSSTLPFSLSPSSTDSFHTYDLPNSFISASLACIPDDSSIDTKSPGFLKSISLKPLKGMSQEEESSEEDSDSISESDNDSDNESDLDDDDDDDDEAPSSTSITQTQTQNTSFKNVDSFGLLKIPDDFVGSTENPVVSPFTLSGIFTSGKSKTGQDAVRERRSRQKYYAFQELYAKSLELSFEQQDFSYPYPPPEPAPITPPEGLDAELDEDGNIIEGASSSKKSKKGGKKGKGAKTPKKRKQKKISGKQRNLLNIFKQKIAKREKDIHNDLEQAKNVITNMLGGLPKKKIPLLSSFFHNLLFNTALFKSKYPETWCYFMKIRIHILEQWWKLIYKKYSGSPAASARFDESFNGPSSPIFPVVQMVRDFASIYSSSLDIKDPKVTKHTKELALKCIKIFYRLGFEEAAVQLEEDWQIEIEEEISPSYPPPKISSYFEFYTNYLGSDLTPRATGVPDSRVTFVPDDWQLKLLDIVDAGESALVSAPTSSGKTFVSFYAMKQVVEAQDPSGVVVFVAPTVELVNQVVAEVYFMCKQHSVTRPLFGVFTETWVENPLSCHILITLPSVFLKLLVDPSPRMATWRKNLRHVIFDEVHCAADEPGTVWFNCLALNKAPFLALSATLASIEEFHSWLCATSTTKVHKIVTHRRATQIQRHVVINSTKTVELHPLSHLSIEALRFSGFPADLLFSPAHCYSVFKALGWEKNEGHPLHPSTFFDELLFPSLNKYREWEAWLKKVIIRLPLKQQTKILNQFKIDNIIVDISSEAAVTAVNEPLEDSSASDITDSTNNNALLVRTVNQFDPNQFLTFLRTLEERDQLPCLAFSFDVSVSLKMCTSLIEILMEVERKKKAISDAISPPKEVVKAAKSEKRTRDRKKTRQEREQELRTQNANAETVQFDDPETTFVSPQYAADPEELDKLLTPIFRRTSMTKEHPLIIGLQKGIACHHASLPTAYRRAVEILFRQRHLKIVIASKTLALGLSMPCRSVIFFDDNAELDPLVYRQMAGRSGRRGYDRIGHVYFYHVGISKIFSLLSSSLPCLSPSFPINSTLSLQLLSSSKYYKLRELIPAFCRPLTNRISRSSVYRFLGDLELFSQLGFIHPTTGIPKFMGTLPLVMHNNPSAFFFYYLFSRNIFHSWLETANPETRMISFCVLLNRCFTSFEVDPITLDTRIAATSKSDSSANILPGLHDTFKEQVTRYNDGVLKVYSKMLARVNSLTEESMLVLPLSHVDFTKDSSVAGSIFPDTDLNVLSPFCQISQKFDKIDTSLLLWSLLPHTTHIDCSTWPLIDVDIPLNSVAFDFWTHLTFSTLLKSNPHYPESHIYSQLKEFSFALEKLTSIFERFYTPPDWGDGEVDSTNDMFLKVLHSVRERFKNGFDKIDW